MQIPDKVIRVLLSADLSNSQRGVLFSATALYIRKKTKVAIRDKKVREIFNEEILPGLESELTTINLNKKKAASARWENNGRQDVLDTMEVEEEKTESVNREPRQELKSNVVESPKRSRVAKVKIDDSASDTSELVRSYMSSYTVREVTRDFWKRFSDEWNQLDLLNKNVRGLTDARRQKLNVLLRKYSEDEIITAVRNISNSRFLLGLKDAETRNGVTIRKWQVSIDWFLKEDNFIRVLEGEFTDMQKTEMDENMKAWMENLIVARGE